MIDETVAKSRDNARHHLVLVVTAFWLFVLFPFAQVFSTRSSTFFLTFVFVILLARLAIGNIQSPDGKLINWSSVLAPEPPARRMLLFSIIALLAWCLLSLVWSPLPLEGGKDILVYLGAALSYLLLSHQFRLAEGDYFGRALLVGLVFALLVLVLDITWFRSLYKLFTTNVMIDDLNRNAATVALLIWPALTFIGSVTLSRKVASLLLLALCFVMVFSSDGQSAQLGILAGLAAGIFSWLSRHLYRLIIAMMALGILVFPLLVPTLNTSIDALPDRIVDSAHVTHRIQIWRGYAELVGKHPYKGQGMHAHEQRGNDGSVGRFAKQIGLPERANHPHNFILEIWLNLGAIGAVLVSGLLVAAGMLADGFKRKDRVLFIQVLASAFTISALGHGFTQTWWIAAIVIASIAASRAMCSRPLLSSS